MDDVDFFHDSDNTFYVQMSYDLRNESARCQTPNGPSDLCLVAIDEQTGAIVRSTYTNYTVYKVWRKKERKKKIFGKELLKSISVRCWKCLFICSSCVCARRISSMLPKWNSIRICICDR